MLNTILLPLFTLLLVLVSIAMMGCPKSKYPNPPEATQQLQLAYQYKIGPGDSVQVYVWRYPGMSMVGPV